MPRPLKDRHALITGGGTGIGAAIAVALSAAGASVSLVGRRAAPLKEVSEWADGFRQFWDASFARLDAYLEELKEEETDE